MQKKVGGLFGLKQSAVAQINRKVGENGPIVRAHFYTKRKSIDEKTVADVTHPSHYKFTTTVPKAQL